MAMIHPTDDPGFARWIWSIRPACPECGARTTRNLGRTYRREARRCKACDHRFMCLPIAYETDHGGKPVVIPIAG